MLAQAISSTKDNGDQQNNESRFQICSNKGIEQAKKMNAPVPHFRILLADADRDRIHLGLGLLRRDSSPEPAEDGDHVVQTKFFAGIDGQRRVDIAATDQLQAGRGDTDDRRWNTVERNRFADKSGVRRKTALP